MYHNKLDRKTEEKAKSSIVTSTVVSPNAMSLIMARAAAIKVLALIRQLQPGEFAEPNRAKRSRGTSRKDISIGATAMDHGASCCQ